MLLALTFLQCLHTAWAASGASHWTYAGPHGQEHWRDTFEACGGDAQSPIDIDTSLVQYDPSLTPVEPEGYRDPEGASFSLQNNGHTVEMSLPPSLALHGLPHLYRAVQLHLHWGSRGHRAGSEHLVDGRAFPAELHVVHFNADKYPNVSEALQRADGLAVLGVFLEVGETENPAYDHLLAHLEDIEYAEQKMPIAPFSVRELLPAHLGRFFRYKGSLTTPPCAQSVLWTVFEQPAHISAGQLEKLQKSVHATRSGVSPPELLEDNFRRPQPLNRRVVFSSFPVASTGHSAGEIITIVFGVLLGCIGLFLAGWIVAKRIRKKRTQCQKDVIFTSSSPWAVLD
ncbi:hypothetical protein lerEdw1_011554 [Lerista edwardsae]|nr:hypothetical protein lerEdw1_011554 [Lerista edwardsae]